jgi:hypothetical protein
MVYLFIPVIMVVCAFLFGARFYFSNTRRMTSFTTGTVVRADERVVVHPNRRLTETEVVIRYHVGRKDYELRKMCEGARAAQYPEGRQLSVRYNPGFPAMSDLAR